MSEWTSFGRIDADGTVYVKTAEGERAVGSWQAGTPEEGLAHFARRFADLVTEVDLIEARLSTGAADPARSATSIRRLRESLAEAHVVGDVDGLAARLDKLASLADEKAVQQRAERDAARAEAVARKTTLVEEAEQIATESTAWKVSGDRLREILDEWRAIRGVDKKTDGELWKRYAAARDGFARRRGAHFASLDASRKQAQGAKEELVAQAEALADSTDWTETANQLKELMNQWKAAPRASKDAEQRLWAQFRAAQDTFFSRRSEVFSARDAEQKDNLARRQELVARAEALDLEADPRGAQSAMREILTEWGQTGRVRREAAAPLERRLRAVEDKVRKAMDTAWRRPDPAANPLLDQMRSQVTEAEERLERARTAGDQKRIAEAEDALASKRQLLALAERAT
ncbi:DUF349 domain-containing protein [Natronosporangium hydrolyticum]|uniref:DUF349 domain-containing protein n=1 Tax=Natronosporangium hydrolyticum TaxID=2811111 RepID=A0A895YAV7_9ACTN|nr:DUF349 domain-containing protein [Natronosporangium hydrolyticum]QSB13425.1 DUF349 domain-containing protein [Natronosporangium hydrolyticum]